MRNIEKEKDREKEKIGDIGPAKPNDKKSDRGVERQIRSHFLLEEQNEFVAAVGKGEMLAATQEKMRGSEEHVRPFLHKTCNQEVSGRITLQSCKTTAKK